MRLGIPEVAQRWDSRTGYRSGRHDGVIGRVGRRMNRPTIGRSLDASSAAATPKLHNLAPLGNTVGRADA